MPKKHNYLTIKHKFIYSNNNQIKRNKFIQILLKNTNIFKAIEVAC